MPLKMSHGSLRIGARHTQAKRHAWGAIDLAYIVCQYVKRMDRVPFRKVYKLFPMPLSIISAGPCTGSLSC